MKCKDFRSEQGIRKDFRWEYGETQELSSLCKCYNDFNDFVKMQSELYKLLKYSTIH